MSEFHGYDKCDVDADQLTPGWIPECWEIGEPVWINKGLNTFVVTNDVSAGSFQFNNSRLPEFFAWLEWWNDD